MTTQETTDTTFAQRLEQQLWTDYTVLHAREGACDTLSRQAWGAHVRANRTPREQITWRVYTRCVDLRHTWRDRADAAYRAWQKVAYPLYGWPPVQDD